MMKSFLIGLGKVIWYAYIAPLLAIVAVFGLLYVTIGSLPN